MKIYTKTGDKGMTTLIGGERVPKNDLRVEAYGTIDELDAHIGLVRAYCMSDNNKAPFIAKMPKDTLPLLLDIRKALFVACSFTACCSIEIGQKLEKPDYSIIPKLEKAIDQITKELPNEFNLTILGEDILSSEINIARAVCRRSERCVIAIGENVAERDYILQLLNRLSDYLYVLLRYETL